MIHDLQILELISSGRFKTMLVHKRYGQLRHSNIPVAVAEDQVLWPTSTSQVQQLREASIPACCQALFALNICFPQPRGRAMRDAKDGPSQITQSLILWVSRGCLSGGTFLRKRSRKHPLRRPQQSQVIDIYAHCTWYTAPEDNRRISPR